MCFILSELWFMMEIVIVVKACDRIFLFDQLLICVSVVM